MLRDFHIEVPELFQGEYYVYVELDLNEGQSDIDFVVTCYGASETKFESVQVEASKSDVLSTFF